MLHKTIACAAISSVNAFLYSMQFLHEQVNFTDPALFVVAAMTRQYDYCLIICRYDYSMQSLHEHQPLPKLSLAYQGSV